MTVHHFPGAGAAARALSDPKTSPQARTAAHDLLFAARCEDYRRLTDAELAAAFPFIAADRFPKLRPPEPQRGWLALRGWEIPLVGTAVLIAAYAGVAIIEALVAVLVQLWGGA